MIPWVELDRTRLPAGDLRLMQRGEEFAIKLGVNELMTSRQSGSEEALATLSCEKLRGRKNQRLLIGGLGMGFTLRAALSVSAADASIVVAELVPAVIGWAKGPLAPLFAGCLEDPRVTLIETDVAALIRKAKPPYDAILLDVDNGPEGMTQSANDRLYDPRGLGAAWTALRPGGVLAVWSSTAERAFTKRLQQCGFDVEERRVRAGGVHGGARHMIWLATRTS